MKRLRRSMLFCPANNPKMLANAKKYGSDCIIYDLEDAIAYNEKADARKMLCEALENNDFGEVEIFARINPLYTEFCEADVKELVKSGVKNIRLPMCESKENIQQLSQILSYYEKLNSIEEGMVKIQGAIETPKGVINAMEIAEASERVISISFGTGDYTNCLVTDRTKDPSQFLYARSHIVLCANAAGIDSIDTVYFDIKDLEGFREETEHAKLLGFTGKSCIHPTQIPIVHEIYTPSEKEIDYAKQVVDAGRLAEEKGLGVVTLNGKMIDKPVIDKAIKILERAIEEGESERGN